MTGRRSTGTAITLWVLGSLLGAMFLIGGATKVLGMSMQVENFARWGLADWLRPVVGGIEILAAVLLIVPRTRFYGGVVIIAIMVGGALTHLLSGVDMQMVPTNVALIGLSGWIAWSHRPEFVRRDLAQDGV